MTHLTTLSTIIAGGGRYDLHKDMIGSILAALPESCINLELDLDPVNIESKGPGSAHICEMISPHLSRLHHLRLEIGTICPALFGDHFAIDGSLQRENPPPLSHYYYPALQTFIINCNFWGSALTCNINGATAASEALPPARVALVQCLRHLFLRGSFPRIQRLWLLDGQLNDNNDESVYAAWNRRDIVNNKTWAIPWVDVKGPTPISFYSVIRTPEGRELVTPSQYTSVFAEDQTWKESTLGSRFPAAVLADRGDFIVRDPPALSVSEYRSMYKGSCLAWRHEQITGRKLLWATQREGLVDRSPLHEITPPGWRRGIGYEGAIYPIPSGPAVTPPPDPEEEDLDQECALEFSLPLPTYRGTIGQTTTSVPIATPPPAPSPSSPPAPAPPGRNPATESYHCYDSGSWISRAAAIQAIDNFCNTWDGTVLDASQPNTLRTLTSYSYDDCIGDLDACLLQTIVSVTVVNGCGFTMDGPSPDQDCGRILREPIDKCNTASTQFKQGGTVTSNCAEWRIDPGVYW
ncbi:hypothetical protein Asppvi_005448 [Aspergillus pseudoviridinutans]|uniref:Uncharacterized protein n=1 Tax=Aspergillus pseudoviridinutans TaxID=1517512 RepID=A0A9P3EST0_9EURO|nr:uncharacterized protein Asppvi_005448 [Aspergillus pseudoviridinutans]GIJ86559.1 hypothetical protein Asppvi_005448 [Aspergillus pseudoviridinutans]